VPSADAYILLKFYECTSSMVQRLIDGPVSSGSAIASVNDFPFRLSELENQVCLIKPKPPSTVLLMGRSGTGKTTCLAFRMWSQHKKHTSEYSGLDGGALPPSLLPSAGAAQERS
jgi:hypothetical protein